MEKNLLTNHHRNLDAATPIRFATLSCKRQKHYAHSRSSKEPWRNHFTAIYRHWVANHNRTASTKTAHTNLKQPLLNCSLFRTRPNASRTHRVRFHPHQRVVDEAIRLRSPSTTLQITIELRRPTQHSGPWMEPLQCDQHTLIQLCARKHRASCDPILIISVTLTRQFDCAKELRWCGDGVMVWWCRVFFSAIFFDIFRITEFRLLNFLWWSIYVCE